MILMSWWRRLRAVIRKGREDSDLDAELRFHIDEQVEENLRRGMPEKEARRRALRDLGGMDQIKEAHRDARGVPWLEVAWRDGRYAVRTLAKKPGLTAAAVLTLGLGIGVNTAVFSVTKAVVLDPLPYPEPGRLVRVWPEALVNTEFFAHYREMTDAFEAISIAHPTSVALTGTGRPEELPGTQVTSGHFTVMGVQPFLGRGFHREETEPGRGDVVVLSYALWQRLFGGGEDAIGRTLSLGGRPRTVVGVMPAGYKPLDGESRLWIPLEIDPSSEEHVDWIAYWLYGRLGPDVTYTQGTDDLKRGVAAYVEDRPGYFERMAKTAGITNLHEHLVGDFRETFLLLAGGMLLVLIVACANVANLLLARVAHQRRELALRHALGAGPGRLVSQILAQSVLLSIAGGAAGMLAARLSLAALVDLLPESMPRTGGVEIDAAVLVFTFGIALAAGLLFGLLPAVRASRTAPGDGIKVSIRGGVSHHHRLSNALIAVEVGIAMALVAGTGLLVKSFAKLQEVDTGFTAENVIAMYLQPPASKYPGEEERRKYFLSVVERVKAVPGVESAGVINRLPMTPGDIKISGFHPAAGGSVPEDRAVSIRLVSPEFLDVLEIPLAAGRSLSESDAAGAPAVGLINETMARQFWGDADPVGARLVFDTGEPWFTVAGVVKDIRQHRLDVEVKPQVYQPLGQAAWESRMALMVRAEPGRPPAHGDIEQAIWAVDPSVPIVNATSMDEVIRLSLKNPRMMTTLFSLFGLVALGLGLIGVFGVTAYAVGQRTRENGVRIALGATPAEVVWASLRRTLKPVATGLAGGCVLAFWLTRFLEGFLFEVRALDLTVFGLVAIALAGSATAAGYLPARRAAAADPVEALRQE